MYFEQFTSFEFASDFLRINIKCWNNYQEAHKYEKFE